MPTYPLNGTHYTAEDDLTMMRHPDDWPRWPLLPVKRDRWTCGVLTEGESEEAEPVVRDWIGGEVLVEYETLEALVADGWRVD